MEIDNPGYHWTAASTKAQAEMIAERSIRDAGYEPWLPVFKKRLRGMRIENGRRIRCRGDSFEDRPLLRGYVFIAIPYGDAGYAIDTAAGVQKLLRYPSTENEWGKPKIIRARFIIQLREWVDIGLCENEQGKIVPYKETRMRDDLSIGDKVRTPTGIVATLLALDEKGRADLLAELMGAERLIRDVDAETLELVGS